MIRRPSERSGSPAWYDSCLFSPLPWRISPIKSSGCHFPPQTHTIFSLLGLDHAYVTSIGRLIGVVSLKEVRLLFPCLFHLSLENAATSPLWRGSRSVAEMPQFKSHVCHRRSAGSLSAASRSGRNPCQSRHHCVACLDADISVGNNSSSSLHLLAAVTDKRLLNIAVSAHCLSVSSPLPPLSISPP